ncbi:putative endo-1,3(4)-beta-glucanase, partial [Zopfochytrium polystomum]
FLDHFTYFTDPDPTHGTVQYVNRSAADALSLIALGPPTILAADATHISPAGRASLRITSRTSYSSGTLFLFDIAHMPAGCGTWPAVWLLGPDWPNGGEVDVLEGVHLAAENQVTLHTAAGCAVDAAAQVQTGTTVGSNCESPGVDNAGCGVRGGSGSYGAAFNGAGGGVYATEWAADAIRVWFFPRAGLPSGVSAALAGNNTAAVPSAWGAPLAHFPLGSACSPDHFRDMQIVVDLTFCGDWAGPTYGPGCTGGYGDAACQNFVINNPQSFKEAYWSFNSIRTFKVRNGEHFESISISLHNASS